MLYMVTFIINIPQMFAYVYIYKVLDQSFPRTLDLRSLSGSFALATRGLILHWCLRNSVTSSPTTSGEVGLPGALHPLRLGAQLLAARALLPGVVHRLQPGVAWSSRYCSSL